MARKRISTEYAVFKMYRSPTYWDGPYNTLKKAIKDFNESYVNPAPSGQDFAIFKITYTQLKVPCPTKNPKKV